MSSRFSDHDKSRRPDDIEGGWRSPAGTGQSRAGLSKAGIGRHAHRPWWMALALAIAILTPALAAQDSHVVDKAESVAKLGTDDSSDAHDRLPEGNADLSGMLRLWGVFGAKVRSGCSKLHIGELRCLQGKADFDTIKEYNLPVLLELEGKEGRRQTVMLSRIKDDGIVTVQGDEDSRDVDQKRLLDAWTGRFKLIWRSAADSLLIKPGTESEAVVWLRETLESLDDGSQPGSNDESDLSPIYDKDLTHRLKSFQRSHGLDDDGIVGPRTQIMLDMLMPSSSMPTLDGEQESSDKS